MRWSSLLPDHILFVLVLSQESKIAELTKLLSEKEEEVVALREASTWKDGRSVFEVGYSGGSVRPCHDSTLALWGQQS